MAVVQPSAREMRAREDRQSLDGFAAAAEHLPNIALFWSPHGIPSPTDPFRSSGAYVAAATWARALICYGKIANPHYS